jgi:hypothetical protein
MLLSLKLPFQRKDCIFFLLITSEAVAILKKRVPFLALFTSSLVNSLIVSAIISACFFSLIRERRRTEDSLTDVLRVVLNFNFWGKVDHFLDLLSPTCIEVVESSLAFGA